VLRINILNNEMFTPNNYPRIVYKYRNWESLIQRKSITNNEIYFASPKSLNDPLEFINLFHYELLNYEKQIAFISKIIIDNTPNLTKQKIYENAIKWIAEDKKAGYIKLIKHGRNRIKDLRKKVGVFSTGKSANNNHLWVNYANNYRGFCIGYDFEELRNFLSIKYHSSGFGGDVTYKETLPLIIPHIEDILVDISQLCLIKLNNWKLEAENRMLKFGFSNCKASVKSSIIKEIIIGEDMSSQSKKKLLKYVFSKYHDCKIYIAKRPEKLSDLNANLIQIINENGEKQKQKANSIQPMHDLVTHAYGSQAG